MIDLTTEGRMRAVISDRPGSPAAVRVTEVQRPAVVHDGLLIRVRASSANPADAFLTTRAGYLIGGRKPLKLGSDFAGQIEAVGKEVNEFQPGDDVFGGARGAFAEYVAMPARGAVVRKPASVSFEHAGTVAVAATTALQALRNHGRLEPGQKVLINGASGGVGTFAVQIAKALGGDVTAVCSNRNVEAVASIGADRVIDYTREDFTQDGARYDLMLDISGSRRWSECARVLGPAATYVGVGSAALQHGRGGMLRVLRHLTDVRLGSLVGRRRVVVLFLARLNKADLEFLGGLMESGRLTPAIERRCSLAETPEALRYLGRGHARAKVAIQIDA